MLIDADVQAILEDKQQVIVETKLEDLKVGDIVYRNGDYGTYNTKYEIIKITNSQDPEIKDVSYTEVDYNPDKEAKQLIIVKELEGKQKLDAYKPKNFRGDDAFILVSEIDALGIDKLDLPTMSESLKVALKDAGIDTDLEITAEDSVDRIFPKIRIKGKTNLADQAGIWKFAINEMYLETFSSAFIDMRNKEIEFDLHYDYKHIRGGLNGCDCGIAVYSLTDNTWKVTMGE